MIDKLTFEDSGDTTFLCQSALGERYTYVISYDNITDTYTATASPFGDSREGDELVYFGGCIYEAVHNCNQYENLKSGSIYGNYEYI